MEDLEDPSLIFQGQPVISEQTHVPDVCKEFSRVPNIPPVRTKLDPSPDLMFEIVDRIRTHQATEICGRNGLGSNYDGIWIAVQHLYSFVMVGFTLR